MSMSFGGYLGRLLFVSPTQTFSVALFLFVIREWCWNFFRLRPRKLGIRILKQLGRTYITAELLFFVYYFIQRRKIQATKTCVRVEWDFLGLLRKCMETIEQIHKGSWLCALEDNKELEETQILDIKRQYVFDWFFMDSGDDHPEQLGSDPERRKKIKKGHVENWMASNFFNRDPSELKAKETVILGTLVNEIEKFTETRLTAGTVGKDPDWKSPEVRSMRLTHDPITSSYRPLASYMITGGLLNLFKNNSMEKLGFTFHRVGNMSYWHRPKSWEQDEDVKAPFVLCHGLGIGLLPYHSFILDLIESGRECFAIEMPCISMRVQPVIPTACEIVLGIETMLRTWNVQHAHFIGHSFGTAIVAWVVRKAKYVVSRATFIDPVPFLLYKADLCWNFFYKKPTTFKEVMFRYFIAEEIYTAHMVHRGLVWHETILFEENLIGIPSLVVLGGKDSIIPSHSIRHYFTAIASNEDRKSKVKLMWYPNMGHAGIMHNSTIRKEITNNIMEL